MSRKTWLAPLLMTCLAMAGQSEEAISADSAKTNSDAELRRVIQETRDEVRELRTEIHTLHQLLETRVTAAPIERQPAASTAEFANLTAERKAARLWEEVDFWRKKGSMKPAAIVCKRLIKDFPNSKFAALAREWLAKPGPNEKNESLQVPDASYAAPASLRALPRETALYAFVAKWCGPCQQIAPLLEKLQAEGPVEIVDVDRFPDLAKAFGVSRLPSFVVVTDGKPDEQFSGVPDEPRLRQLLKKATAAASTRDNTETFSFSTPSSNPGKTAKNGAVTGDPLLESALAKPVDFKFINVTLREFAAEISRRYDINVVIDTRAFEERGIHSNRLPSIDAKGITLDIQGVPLSRALHAALDPLELDFVLREGVLVITGQKLELQIYPVADLITDESRINDHGEADFSYLTNLIVSNVSPSSWEGQGGHGEIQTNEATLSLAVRQTRTVHAQIRDALEQVRRIRSLSVHLKMTVIDHPSEDLLAIAGLQPKTAKDADAIPLTDEQRHAFQAAAVKSRAIIVENALTFGFGQTVSLPMLGSSKSEESIVIQPAISPDAMSVALNVAGRIASTGEETRKAISAKIPYGKSTLILLRMLPEASGAVGGKAAANSTVAAAKKADRRPIYLIVHPSLLMQVGEEIEPDVRQAERMETMIDKLWDEHLEQLKTQLKAKSDSELEDHLQRRGTSLSQVRRSFRLHLLELKSLKK